MKTPRHAGDLLRGLMREVGSRAGRSRVSSAVEDAVGEHLAPHVDVAGFRKGTLTIEVDSPALLAELRGFRSEEIRLTCNERLDLEKIARIVFRLRGTGHV